MLTLAEIATQTDGVSPFNEATRIALSTGAPLRLSLIDEVGAAVGVGDAPAEFVVHPRYRRQGRGTLLLRALLDRGERDFWAHGDLPAAQALAAAMGLQVARTLLVLRTEESDLVVPPAPEGVVLRTFTEGDVEQIIAVNARAFADHPEQGAMDRADFDHRRTQDWFDPAGLFVAERDGQVLGFHWTKREDDIGEVYVVAVDPSAHGSKIGSALTAHGMRHLWGAGVTAIELYVEGENTAALAVYARLGFTEHARDVMYRASEG